MALRGKNFMLYFNATHLLIPSIIIALLTAVLILLRIFRKKSEKHPQRMIAIFLEQLPVPLQILLILTSFYMVLESLKYEWTWNPVVNHVYAVLAIILLGWLAIQAVSKLSKLLLKRYDVDRKDNYRARKIHTLVRILKRVTVAVIIFLVAISILLTFEGVQEHGASLLASAGVISIIIGLAAQKTIGNLFAGVQIAVAQPIRVDDVVVVENEWGRIEEINLTYVVLKLWDLRRLVLPISYFTEKPFQNWTRQKADILGTIMIYVDYTMPVQLIRDELDRLLEGNNLWDKKVKVVQVTNTKEKTMEIRILVSSLDSVTSFDLRCAVREGIITFIQEKYPQYLPRIRTEAIQETRSTVSVKVSNLKDPVRSPVPTFVYSRCLNISGRTK